MAEGADAHDGEEEGEEEGGEGGEEGDGGEDGFDGDDAEEGGGCEAGVDDGWWDEVGGWGVVVWEGFVVDGLAATALAEGRGGVGCCCGGVLEETLVFPAGGVDGEDFSD